MRAPVAAALALLALAAAGCGDGSSFSDDEIAAAIALEDDAVEGDPFCVVSDYLNDVEEVGGAEAGDPVLASREGNVGVVVEPPFPSDCERRVRRGLDRLDARPNGE